jgi:hypothetical protein
MLLSHSHNIEANLTSRQLISRLNADELTRSRAFSTAVEQSKRPVTKQSETPKTVRHFNTSRSLKAVKDSSTMDFTYLPDIDPNNEEGSVLMRVPILPDNYDPPRTGAHAHDVEETVSLTFLASRTIKSCLLTV